AAGPAVDHDDRRVARRRERGPDLENEDGVGVAQCVEREGSRQLGGSGRITINARDERSSSQVETGQVVGGWARLARENGIRGGDGRLGGGGVGVSAMYRAGDDDAGWKA